MYWDLLNFPIEHERLRWTAGEAIRDLVDGRRLFVRVTLTGTRFVGRALEPQVWVGKTYARYVEIAEDGLSVKAYFDEMPPSGTLYFGYAGRAELAFGDFEPERVPLLDRARLPKDVAMPGEPERMHRSGTDTGGGP